MKITKATFWIVIEHEGKAYRKKVEGYPVTVKGAALAAHPSVGYTGGRDLWNTSDLITGRKVGPRGLRKQGAIRNTIELANNLEKKFKKSFSEILDDTRKEFDPIATFPELP